MWPWKCCGNQSCSYFTRKKNFTLSLLWIFFLEKYYRCGTPPPDGSDNLVEFKLDEYRRSDEKKLRSQLSKTLEWNDDAIRKQTADSLEIIGKERIAHAIRSKRGHLMRKGHLLCLCRVWKYKSNLWSSKKPAFRATKKNVVITILTFGHFSEKTFPRMYFWNLKSVFRNSSVSTVTRAVVHTANHRRSPANGLSW